MLPQVTAFACKIDPGQTLPAQVSRHFSDRHHGTDSQVLHYGICNIPDGGLAPELRTAANLSQS